MPEPIRIKERQTPWLERFGVYYLDLFRKRDLTHHVFDLSDAELTRRVGRISNKGMILSALVGFVCVWPTVYIAVLNQAEPWYAQLAWTAGATLISTAIEFYFLFIVALKAVHEVSELTNMRGHAKGRIDFLHGGPFSITNILARAALEIHDPELHILGIDPFKRVSKMNLLLLGLLYKCKIILTNFIAKRILLWTIGATVVAAWVTGGISINYIACPVECFWNALILLRVVREARLRLFGFALCHEVADRILAEHALSRLGEQARIGCLQAIGNAVVLARNFHPNIVILLFRIRHLLHIPGEYTQNYHLDDWNLWIETLDRVSEKERLFLLNLFTIAIAFEGRILRVEKTSLRDVYGKDYDRYRPRLWALTEHLRTGRLNAAADLCKIDFTAG